MAGHAVVTAQGDREMDAEEGFAMDWLQIVRSEYLEVPGLHLNRAQVRRFWNLDDVTCDELLGALTSVKFLRRTSAGAYVRTDGGAS